jgi:hypothetical protein
VRIRRAAAGTAIAIAAGLALLHLAGARAHVGLLSGTLPAARLDVGLGVAYVLGWFGAVLVAPIVVLAVVVDVAWRRLAGRLPRWRGPRRSVHVANNH